MSDTKSTKSKPSTQSKWIGVLVLGFGALCLAAVGIIIYQSTSGGRVEPQTVQSTQMQTTSNTTNQRSSELSRSLNDMPSMQSQTQSTSNNTQDFDISQISGAWEGMLSDSMVGIIEITRDGYRLILSNDNPSSARFFSSGAYTILDNNILVLSPDNAARGPNDGFRYRALYNKPFSVKLEQRGEYLVWSRPAAGVGVVNPPSHPILRLSDDGFIIWNKF